MKQRRVTDVEATKTAIRRLVKIADALFREKTRLHEAAVAEWERAKALLREAGLAD